MGDPNLCSLNFARTGIFNIFQPPQLWASSKSSQGIPWDGEGPTFGCVSASGFLLPGGIFFGILHWSNKQWEGRKAARGLPMEKFWSECSQVNKHLIKKINEEKKEFCPWRRSFPGKGAGLGWKQLRFPGMRMWGCGDRTEIPHLEFGPEPGTGQDLGIHHPCLEREGLKALRTPMKSQVQQLW